MLDTHIIYIAVSNNKYIHIYIVLYNSFINDTISYNIIMVNNSEDL